jgi:hypothetical protein
MPQTRQSIPSLMNGVSQQPASLRHASQCEEQLNCLPHLAVGLEKRPATDHITQLNTNTGEDAFWHLIERDATNRFILEVAENANTDLEVYVTDLAGAAKTVNYDTVTFWSMARAVAIADGTAQRIYLPAANTTIQLVWTPATDNGSYVRATVTAWTAGTIDCTIVSDDIYYLQTAAQPRDALRATTIADYTFITNSEVPVLMDTVRSGDNTGETLTGTVQTFGDLPGTPSGGNIYKITGDENTNFDEYFVRYDGTDAVWYEHFEPGNNNYFDLTTMPYTVVNEADGTFSVAPGAWLEREVGDNVTSPQPGFVGEFIVDIVFYRNRIGLLAGESLTLSRAGNSAGGYFQFWNQSVQTVLDSDPIGINMPHEKVATLQFGKTFNEALLLFARGTQFIMDPAGTLTPLTAAISPTTEFSASPNAKPAAIGNNVYFLVDNGDNQQVREYFVQSDLGVNDANDITSHVQRYVPKQIHHLAGSSNQDLLLGISDDTGQASRIYIYKFFWSGQKKAQAAWGYWDFGTEATVHYAEFLDSKIYLVIEYNDGVYLLSMDLNSDLGFDDIGVKIHLDRRESLLGVYDSGNDWTTWTISGATALDDSNVIYDSGFGDPGTTLTVTYPTTTTIRASGDHSASNCWVGHPYSMEYTFSEQFQRRPAQSADQTPGAVLVGRLQMRRWNVRYVDTGYFRVEVTPQGRDVHTKVFAGKVLGANIVLGTININTGTFTFDSFGRSSDITVKLVNDTWLPSTFLSAEWIGTFSPKAVLPAS